jgi:hypothetical protein
MPSPALINFLREPARPYVIIIGAPKIDWVEIHLGKGE